MHMHRGFLYSQVCLTDIYKRRRVYKNNYPNMNVLFIASIWCVMIGWIISLREFIVWEQKTRLLFIGLWTILCPVSLHESYTKGEENPLLLALVTAIVCISAGIPYLKHLYGNQQPRVKQTRVIASLFLLSSLSALCLALARNQDIVLSVMCTLYWSSALILVFHKRHIPTPEKA